jgi:peptidyl-prolyl cis-trans isomerase B (cyclophilin B)
VCEQDYDVELDQPLTQKQIDVYTTVGGVPHLDGGYTVFGKVVKGIDVVEKIASVKTAPGDRPVEDVIMVVEVEKVSRRKIEKEFNYTYPSE